MSPKPIDKPKRVLDPRAFDRINPDAKGMTKAERKDHAKKIQDELAAEFGPLRNRKNAG